MSVVVNDIHSELNEATVREVVAASSPGDVQQAIRRAAEIGLPVAIAAGRHAMGGQQFCSDGLLVDTRGLAHVVSFDADAGRIVVQAGIQWPALLAFLRDQPGGERAWAFRQKQTGADRLSIGGALAANAHGRGLAYPPFASDVESFTLVDSAGELVTCSRTENTELFALVAGGYGLFGCVVDVTMRLVRRQTVERVVEVREIEDLSELFASRIADGFLYGDFQFATDPASDDFLRRGVFSCYRPIEHEGPLPDGQRALTRDDWRRLLVLAHTDKRRAFEEYAEHYLATSGQLYDSDAHQMGDYEDGYHRALDAHLGSPHRATEMISELYVPRERLGDFMADVAADFREGGVDAIYGTIRLIERDEDSFLAWAREPWACVIFNLHTVHTDEGLEQSANAFRRLIDRASDRGGSYFLTYHRWATREQVERCYPRFPAFLEAKQRLDPGERFQSDWYRHHKRLFE
ncbi:MAG: FAD-binding oxidoreductase [Gaiellaceae bacterium]